MSETWRLIRGFEGLYDISDHGRVRSWRGKGTARDPQFRLAEPFILKPWANQKGYLGVALYDNGRCVRARIHRLVALAFIGEPPTSTSVIRHLDGNNRNNAPSNLAWGTVSQNNQDTVRHGRNPLAARTHCGVGHPFDEVNSYVASNGYRTCRECRRQKARAAYHRRRAARAVAA